jgi:hypothetical protein
LLSGGLRVNSAIRSELGKISTTISTRFEVFSESAFMRIGNYGSREKVKMSVAILLQFTDYYSFSLRGFSKATNSP